MDQPREIDWQKILQEEVGLEPPDNLRWQAALPSGIPVQIPKWSKEKNTFVLQSGYILRYSSDGLHAFVLTGKTCEADSMRVGLLEKLNGPLHASADAVGRVKLAVLSVTSLAVTLYKRILGKDE